MTKNDRTGLISADKKKADRTYFPDGTAKVTLKFNFILNVILFTLLKRYFYTLPNSNYDYIWYYYYKYVENLK